MGKMTQTAKVSQPVSHLSTPSLLQARLFILLGTMMSRLIIQVSQSWFPDLMSPLPHNHHLLQSPGAPSLSFLLLLGLISQAHLPLASHSVSTNHINTINSDD